MIKVPQRFIELTNDRLFKWTSRLTLIAFALGFVLLGLNRSRLPPVVPLFYSLPWGEEQLVSPFHLLLFLIGLVGLYGANLVCIYLLYPTSRYFTRILMIGSGVISLLGVVTLTQIIRLIT